MIAVIGLLVACSGESTGGTKGPATLPRACGYVGTEISDLRAFERLVGRRFSCVLVFNDAAPTWKAWADPYFLVHVDKNKNWGSWKRRRRGRELIVTQGLFPSPLKTPDILRRGAAGEFRPHARRLARKLIAHGLGRATIRLGHEANFTIYAHSLPDDLRGQREWAGFWRQTVGAMRSVKGARFRFDWTINANYRRIPLDNWYPGDKHVDIIGIDAYDTGVRPGLPRWKTIYERPLGVRELARFARRHGKPLSVPEWGLAPMNSPKLLSGGDNPGYVEGLARVLRGQRSSYQSYFFSAEFAETLRRSPRSLRAYKRLFGRRGTAVRR